MQQVTNLKYLAAEIRENLVPSLKVENVSSNCATMDGNQEAIPVENHFQMGRFFGIFTPDPIISLFVSFAFRWLHNSKQ